MNTNQTLAIVKRKLVDEWQQLPVPLESDRILEMINIAMENAKTEIERLNASLEQK